MRSLLATTFLWLALFAHLAQAGTHEALEVVKTTTDQVLAALRDEQLRQDRARVFELIEQVIVPHFDFAKMSRWVLGKHWKEAAPREQERFAEEFRRLLVRTYATALMEYSDEEVVLLPFHAEGGSEAVTVKTVVNRKSGPPIPIDYRLGLRDGAWKVFDVTIDGVSLVGNYRSSFSEEIGRKGLAGLIDELAARNQQ